MIKHYCDICEAEALKSDSVTFFSKTGRSEPHYTLRVEFAMCEVNKFTAAPDLCGNCMIKFLEGLILKIRNTGVGVATPAELKAPTIADAEKMVKDDIRRAREWREAHGYVSLDCEKGTIPHHPNDPNFPGSQNYGG